VLTAPGRGQRSTWGADCLVLIRPWLLGAARETQLAWCWIPPCLRSVSNERHAASRLARARPSADDTAHRPRERVALGGALWMKQMATRHRLRRNLLICVALHISREKSRLKGLALLPQGARLARSQILYCYCGTVLYRSNRAAQAGNHLSCRILCADAASRSIAGAAFSPARVWQSVRVERPRSQRHEMPRRHRVAPQRTTAVTLCH
jgi:hypothetical protein